MEENLENSDKSENEALSNYSSSESEISDIENLTENNSPSNPSSPTLKSFATGELNDSDDELYLQKFDSELTRKYVNETHPESLINNYNEILALSKVVRNSNNIIIDKFHQTISFLTKYEKTRILGQRVKQLNDGGPPYIAVSENILDNSIIAEMELKEKKLPFIIRRPLPNGASEYWKLEDLELL